MATAMAAVMVAMEILRWKRNRCGNEYWGGKKPESRIQKPESRQ
jgi:hypothetical protein